MSFKIRSKFKHNLNILYDRALKNLGQIQNYIPEKIEYMQSKHLSFIRAASDEKLSRENSWKYRWQNMAKKERREGNRFNLTV